MSAAGNAASAPGSVLVIVTRRLGDVLLATPVMRSVKRAWPRAALDALVFEGTEGIIAANPDVRRILTIPARPRLLQHVLFIAQLLRRYDLALSLVPGDRPTFYAFVAGRRRAGLLLATGKETWKRRFLHHWVPFDEANTHTMLMHLALVEALGIEPQREVAVSWSAQDAARVESLIGGSGPPLAVLHPYPKYHYKMWQRAGWTEIASWLSARGYRVALTGSPDPDEQAYVAALASDMPAGTLNLAGRLSLGGAGYLVSRAAVYVGPDTALTHMAAALGVPTVALYGPTNPVKWGPWPRDHASKANPWARLGSQAVGRVRLIQGAAPCVPCHEEGCDRHIASYSDCLLALPPAKVITALREVAGIRD